MKTAAIPPRRDPRGPSENAALRDPLARGPSRPRRQGFHLGAIGAVIRQARVRKGLSQSEVADALTVNQRTYRLWECGRDRIPNGRVIALCAMLGLSREDIARASTFAETDDEAALLTGYRLASEDRRQAALKAVSRS